MELKCIGKRLREKKIEHSWSQEELAEKANLLPVYIGMISINLDVLGILHGIM